MELIGEEPEDIANLVLEDFRFREGTSADSVAAEELHCLCLGESEQRTVNREQRTVNREQRTVNREQRTENREQRTENSEQRTRNSEQRTRNSEQRTRNSERISEWVFPGEICFVAETAGGEFAGYICAALLPDGTDDCLRVCAVEVQPEYRGLGLGKTLTGLLLEKADSRKISQITIDLPAGMEYFARALLREDFRPSVQRFKRTGNS
jgi:ribosomal protein S18 acetylase RimI-like enzyme